VFYAGVRVASAPRRDSNDDARRRLPDGR